MAQPALLVFVLTFCQSLLVAAEDEYTSFVLSFQLIEAANAMEMPMKEMFQKYCDNLCLV